MALIPTSPKGALNEVVDRACDTLRAVLAIRWENIKNLHQSEGLNTKYLVLRMDARDAPGEKHYNDKCFVLDVTHDPHAIPALRAYADSCQADYPDLASDLRYLAHEAEVRPWKLGRG